MELYLFSNKIKLEVIFKPIHLKINSALMIYLPLYFFCQSNSPLSVSDIFSSKADEIKYIVLYDYSDIYIKKSFLYLEQNQERENKICVDKKKIALPILKGNGHLTWK